jgi:HD-like signal output (HDOD) protein
MMQQGAKDLRGWIAFLSQAEIPVLRQTARDLQTLREDSDKANPHTIAQIVARDPLMTAKLLRYLQEHKRRSQTTELLQVEQALLMLGVEPFFKHLGPTVLAEDLLHSHVDALISTLHVVHRSHRASSYAVDWAVRLRDLHFEEVRVAALLHELAEILMWCFAPEEMLRISAMQQQDKTLRSHAAQEQVLGFSLATLQRELVKEWVLPALLLKLMDEANSGQERVRNVLLAVDLARHSAHGWDDAALPDDYRNIADLLQMKPEQVMHIVNPEQAEKPVV